MSKKAILAWYERARNRVEARSRGPAYGLERLSPADVGVYMKLIEDDFQQLKAAHNAGVMAKRGRAA